MALIFTAILFLVTGSCAESYIKIMSDFVKETLSSCPGVFDCKSNSTEVRGCDCDEDCVRKSTCCYDAPAYDFKQMQKHLNRNRCIKGKKILFGCDEGWGGDGIQELCDAADPESLLTSRDPLLHLPVTSRETRIVYPNYYCAICNKDAEDVFVLDYKFSCSGSSDFENILQSALQKTLDVEYHYNSSSDCSNSHLRKASVAENNGVITKDLNILFDGTHWKATVNPGSENVSSSCITRIVRNYKCDCPDYSRIIDKCDANWNDAKVEGLCRSFQGQMKIGLKTYFKSGQVGIGYKGYRNVFCAICNFVCVTDLCNPSPDRCWNTDRYILPATVSGPSSITRKDSSSTCKDDEDIFPGYCYGGENKLLCALSPSYHRTPLCVKRNKEDRVRAYLACGKRDLSLDEKPSSQTTTPPDVELSSETSAPPLSDLESYTMRDFVNQTLSSCPGIFDCKSGSSLNKRCDCDHYCAKKGTCCYDAPVYDNELMKKNAGRNKCRFETQILFECDEGWKDDEIKEMCKAADPYSFSKNKDPILHLPVTSEKTKIVYPNYYCSICNNDAEDIVVWDYEFSCFGEGYNYNETHLLQSALQRYLSSGAEESWASVIWAADEAERNGYYGYECRINDYRDSNYWKIRLNESDVQYPETPWMMKLKEVDHFKCRLSLRPARSKCCREQRLARSQIGKCNDNWNDGGVEDLCQSFEGPVEIKGIRYRNVFCAICNHESVSPTTDLCYFGITTCRDRIPPSPPTFLFDLSYFDDKYSNLTHKDEDCFPDPCSYGRNKFLCQLSNTRQRGYVCVKGQ